MAHFCPMYQVRLLEDTRFGKMGESVYLPLEYAEALVCDKRAEVVKANQRATRKSGIPIKPLRGGTERKGAD